MHRHTNSAGYHRGLITTICLLMLAAGCGDPSLASQASAARMDETASGSGAQVSANIVYDWAGAFDSAIKIAGTSPGDTVRLSAILFTAVFDAVNGVTPRYRSIHETGTAPPKASAEAAAAQAARDAMAGLFPAQVAAFDTLLTAELGGLQGSPESIQRGRDWGSKAAADTLAWRSGDGRSCDPSAPGTSCPNVFGSSAIGRWRPVPPAPPSAAAALPQFVKLAPFVLTAPDQFLHLFQGPPALDGRAYATSVNESKAFGSTSSTRSEYQTQVALFWADNAGLHWNRIAVTVARMHPRGLLGTARLFAHLNVTMLDAAVTVWTSKYRFNAWRPYHAIREPTSYNPDVTPDPTFVPLITTPNHQEYGSGHSIVGGAAAVVLGRYFGDDITFTHTTDTVSPLLTSTSRTTTGFSTAAREINDARVFGGIHFRFTVEESAAVGAVVAEYVLRNSLRRIDRDQGGDDDACRNRHACDDERRDRD